MAPEHTLTLRNGPKTDDLKIHMEVNGVISQTGKGQITLNVADETKTIPFRGSIRQFKVIRGAGSASINGQSFRFQDLPGYDTRNGVPRQDSSDEPAGDAPDHDADFILSIGNPNADEKVTYSGNANGYAFEHDDSLEDSDSIEKQHRFGGEVWGRWDHYAIKGWLMEFDLDGAAQVLIDGENVSAQAVTDYRPERFESGGAGGGGGGGGSDTPAPKPSTPDGEIEPGDKTRHGIRFKRVNRVAPGDSLDKSTGTLNALEPGEHRLSGPEVVEGTHRWGVRGLGDEADETRIAPEDGQWLKAIVARGGCTDILLENIAFDQRASAGTGVSVRTSVSDGLEIHDVEWLGQTPNWKDNSQLGANEYSLAASVTDADGVGHISGLEIADGADVCDYPGGTIPLMLPFSSKGTIYVTDSRIESSASHSIYGSKAASVHVSNSVFKNNVNTNMRLSGDSSLKNSKIIVDADKEQFRERDTGDMQRVRGLWWENQRTGASGGLVKNCEFVFDSDVNEQAGRAAVIQINGSAGGLTITDCSIRNETSLPNILVEALGSGARGKTPAKEWVRVSGCSVSGSGNGQLVDDRRGSVEIRD